MDFATKPADDVAAERSGRLNALRSEFLRYVVVGGLAFLVDAGTLFLLTALGHVPYLVSAAAGFLLGLVANYVLSRRWVFRNRTLSSTALEFTVFTLIGLVGLGLNEVLIWAFTDKVGMHYLLSKCFAAGFVLVWTFGARRWALFSGKRAGTAGAGRHLPLEFVAAFAIYSGLTVGLQWAGGAYGDPMMQYPDESAHYVTGVMVHDFLLHPTMHPMEFARQFYVHYPRVSLIHWPPMMYVVEGTWMVPFGTSPASALALIATLAAALALLLHLQASRRLGRPFGWMAGLIFIVLGATQQQAGMIMTEMLLALEAFAACLALAAFLRNGRLRYSLLFGLFAALMILTRGDGWCLALVPPLSILLAGRPSLLLSRRLWVAALVIVPACLPYTLLTYRVAAVGWEEQAFSWAFVVNALPQSGAVLLHAFGAAGLALFGFGIAWYVFGRRAEDSRSDPLWAVLTSLIVAVFVFENVVPAGIEPRKLFALAPPAVLLIVAAAARLGSRVWRTRPAAGALAILVAAGAASGFQVFRREPREPSALHELAREIAQRPDLKDTAFLVSAGAREGVFIGEIAALDKRPSHYVLRATKHLIADCDDYTLRCPAKYTTPDPLLKFLDGVPVSAVVLEPDQPMRPDEVSLFSALNSAPQTWRAEPIPARGGARPAWLYTRREHMAWRAPSVKVELNGKLDSLVW